MDIFTRFNRRDIQDRQTDTLIGLSKGLVADNIVNQAEAEFLLTWLVQNHSYSNNPVIGNLLDKVDHMLADKVLDQEESAELCKILKCISGDPSELGELAKTSTLPINNPLPPVQFSDASFLFTGTCAYGTRKQCQDTIMRLGGINAKSVTKSLDYLVLGTYVTDSWAHESFGRKIEKAVEYRNSGIPLVIITEEHWANEAGL